jgi:hypothetical protein
MIEKETALHNLGPGWHSLIERVYAIQDELSFCDGISAIERKNGMLYVLFERPPLTTEHQEFILSAIEYRLERLTAKLCEDCGQYGIRRTELPTIRSLCTSCYANRYSEMTESNSD